MSKNHRPSVTIGIIALNEAKLITANLAQHYSWADQIVVVEGCDVLYPRRNVSESGLSTDGTAAAVESFPDPEGKIRLIQHGWAGDPDVPGSGKVELRNRYAELAPDGILIVIDADEFYSELDQGRILDAMQSRSAWAFTFPILHLWRGPKKIIVGGYADIPHTRFYRWDRAFRYAAADHNRPTAPGGKSLNEIGEHRVARRLQQTTQGKFRSATPAAIHYGFAKDQPNTRDKTEYYLARGENETRPATSRFRESWFRGELLEECRLVEFAGPLPEHHPDIRLAIEWT